MKEVQDPKDLTIHDVQPIRKSQAAALAAGKGNSDSHGARPVHLIITMIKGIRTSRLSIKNSLFAAAGVARAAGPAG